MSREYAAETRNASVTGEDEESKAVLQCVLEDLRTAETERTKYEEDWDKYQRMYKCILDASKYPWRSRIFDPESYSVVETICPRITNTLVGGAEVFGVKPTGGEDVQKSENTERLLNYQADRMNLYESGGQGFKTSLIEGTGHWKFRWAKEFEPRYEETPTVVPVMDEYGQPVMDETGMPQSELKVEYKKTWECVYDNPKLDWVDNRDIFVDPLATSPEDARFIIHRTYVTRDYLKKKQLEGVYKNANDIAGMAPVASSNADPDEKKVDRGTITFHEKQLEDVELLERWGAYDIDGDGYLEETVIVVANRNTVIKIDYNKLPGAGKPFLRYTPIPDPGKYHGISPLQPIASIQDALNDRTNQIGDAINLTINPMYKKNRWADIDDDDLVSRPGGVIEMNSLGDLEALQPPNLPGAAFAEIGRFESIIQKTTGTFDVARGAVSERQETATTTIALQNVAEIRFKTMAMLAERQFIRPLGSLMIRYNKLYMTQPRQIRILGNDFMLDPSTAQEQRPATSQQLPPGTPPQVAQMLPALIGGGDKFVEVSKDNLAEDPDIYAVGAALEIGASKDMQLNNILKFLQISSNPIFMQNPLFTINHAALIERMPYLMNLKLKQPVITKGNPMLAYAEMQQEKQLADGMMMSKIQGGMPPGSSAMRPGGPPSPQGEMPSRTKGELAKSEVPANQPQP